MEKCSNVELKCSKKPNFIKFTTVDGMENIVQLTIKMEKKFQMWNSNVPPKPYKCHGTKYELQATSVLDFEKFVSYNLLLKQKMKVHKLACQLLHRMQ